MSAKPVPKPVSRSLVPSSLLFRICIGGIAIAFLAVVVFGNMIFEGPGIMDSISAYYYSHSTPMKNVFVGGLCVLATLLMCYRYQPKDHVVSFFAGACAILLAIFPTTDPHTSNPPPPEVYIARAHWVFSIGFLLAIVVIVLYLFTLSKQNQSLIWRQKNWFLTIVYTVGRPFMSLGREKPLSRKRVRNRVYLACGSIMILSLVLCLLVQIFFSSNSQLESIHPVFCCEAITLFLFCVAWVVKGGVILLDENEGGAITFFRRILSGKDPSDENDLPLSTPAIGLSDTSHLTPESPSDDQSRQGAPPT